MWRRGRRIEALGLAWIALAYAPVANLLFPIGVLLAERTLYLPSVGLALAAGALAKNLRGRPLALLVGGVGVLGGARTALRVPVWSSTLSVTLSVLQDSPQSYVGPMTMAAFYFEQGRADKVIEASRIAESIFPFDARPYLMEAHAALKLKHPRLADSLLGGSALQSLPGSLRRPGGERAAARRHRGGRGVARPRPPPRSSLTTACP